ncbi:hypothetical protein [Frigidibacter sp. SD6-1]|uniref:linalool dehydratase/isomerase domain-containing protein n=1 Tax=Frigidibacter sp. SD6-1 TaxID=3032581 RepID=UPI0024DF54C6|nr:hypothetical protein [Frigidibacter sp. SD6-1]
MIGSARPTGAEGGRRLGLSCLTLCLVLAIAALALTLGATPATKAFALGLALPGAGFWPGVFDDGGLVCLGAPAWLSYLAAALLSHLLFLVAVIFWFGAGNVLAPPLVWLASALAAAAAAPALAHAPPLWLCALPFLAWPAAMAAAHLARPRPVPAPPPFAAPAPPAPSPVDADLWRRLSFLTDRALQPVGRFDGFQFVDQFQTAATRYQIAQGSYALALLSARLPGLGGFVAQAQRNLIEKQLDHRIWAYWRLENLWGNLSADPDPVARDNIMYTGFLAAQIALYEQTTGDGRYSAPGALALHHPSGRSWQYDQPALIAALERGWDRAPLGLMACEPNWVYPLCNAIGASALRAHDLARWTARAERFRASLEANFRQADGLLLPFRSSLTGLPAPRLGGAVVEAYPVLFWNVLFPDLAADLWARVRARALRGGALDIRRFWKVDTGDYRLSRAASLAAFAAAAAEMGDREARDLALDLLEADCPAAEGAGWHRPRASVFAHFCELMARLNPGGGYRALFTGEGQSSGPRLDLAAPGRAIVTGARVERGRLHLSLAPHPASTRLDLPFSGFRPGARLRWTGSAAGEAQAELDGTFRLQLEIGGPTTLTLEESA